MIIRIRDQQGRWRYVTHYDVDEIHLEGSDGTVVVYKPLDTVRGPLLQVQEKRVRENGRAL